MMVCARVVGVRVPSYAAVVLHGRLIALASSALLPVTLSFNRFSFPAVPKNKMPLEACGADLNIESSRSG